MVKATLHRFNQVPEQTLGRLVIKNGETMLFHCVTLELGWHGNEKNKSCIPEGNYKAVRRWSNKYGHHWHLVDVPGRSMILIHHGNFRTQIEGCILVGSKHTDINGDGFPDVVESKATMQQMNVSLAGIDNFILTINS